MELGEDYEYPVLFNGTENNEEEPEIVKAAFEIYATALCTIVFCISMPGNSFMVWVLLRERVWWTTSDILLLQFTISNLCYTVTLPFTACNIFHGWIFGEWVCGLIRGLSVLGINSYALILTAMILHCYVTVVPPSCLSGRASSKFGVHIASIVIWLVCAVPSIKFAVHSKVIDLPNVEMCTYAPKSITQMVIDVYMELVFFFLIPSIVIIFCYVHMWLTIKRCRMDTQHQPSKRILWITVGCFLCIAPHNILAILGTLIVLGVLQLTHGFIFFMPATMYITFTLFQIYCCLNPLFHIFGEQRFRRYLPVRCNISPQRRDERNNASPMTFIALHNESA